MTPLRKFMIGDKIMRTPKQLRVILALSLATNFCGAVGLTASAQPQGLSRDERCEQAKLAASAAEAIAIGAVQSARVAEDVAYEAHRHARDAEFRVIDAEALAEAAEGKLAEVTEASRRGYALGPDPSGAARDHARRLTDRDRARELAEDARSRAAERRSDAEIARGYANERRAAAERLKKVAADLCARLQPAE